MHLPCSSCCEINILASWKGKNTLIWLRLDFNTHIGKDANIPGSSGESLSKIYYLRKCLIPDIPPPAHTSKPWALITINVLLSLLMFILLSDFTGTGLVGSDSFNVSKWSNRDTLDLCATVYCNTTLIKPTQNNTTSGLYTHKDFGNRHDICTYEHFHVCVYKGRTMSKQKKY